MTYTDTATATVPRTVLVVEDDVLIRLMVCGVLRDAGLRVIEAGNADEALALLRARSTVDLVFTDIRMTGSLDGAGLARLVRTEFPSIKVIMTSGDMPLKDAEPGVPVIEKPYVLRQVVSIILANLDQPPVSTSRDPE